MPDLKITASFDKTAYVASDLARVTVTIRNTGDAPAEGVRASGGGDLDVWGAWGDLGTKSGISIRPHATRVVELSGRILNADDGKVGFTAQTTAATADPTPRDNATFVEVPLVLATGEFGGTVVADKNGNGTIDPGEGLAGVKIVMSGGVPFGTFTQTTDAQGRFALRDLPLGHYFIEYQAPQPWRVIGLTGDQFDTLDIDASGRYANVTLTAVQPLVTSLRVRMVFDQATYAPGDTTKMAITLTNSSEHELAGVTARCSASENGPELRGGAGWGPLADGAAGVAVPARGTKTVEVTEALPAQAPNYGYVSALCFFGPANYPDHVRVSGEATAKVPGVLAATKGRLAHDRNGNHTVDDGEAIAGVQVAFADLDTGAIVAEVRSGDDGRFEATDVPVGTYEFRIRGPWKHDSCSRIVSVIADPAFPPYTCFLLPGTGQEGKLPNLRVSAQFDKEAYESGDPIHVTLTVSNVGEADAEGVKGTGFAGPAALFVDEFGGGWGELARFGPGAKVRAGETRTFDVVGRASNPDAGIVNFAGSVFPALNNDSYFQNNIFDITVPLTKTTGRYNGVVFVDRNNNGAPDAGEGLDGIKVFAFGGVPPTPYSVITDAQGRFDFGELPTGSYGVAFEDPTRRWVVLGESGTGFDRFQLDKSGHLDALIPAVPPLSNYLIPSIKFNKGTYASGETATLTVTLTNNGSAELTGITATCRSEAPNGLRGGPGWAPIEQGGAGVSLAAGATRTFQVSERVPDEARQSGTVFASCGFGADGHLQVGHPGAFAEARVPGAIGSGRGRLAQRQDNSPEGVPVADVKVVLMDRFTGKPVAKTRSGSDGGFEFRDLPAGHYELRLVGPWRFVDEFGKDFYITEGGSDRGTIFIERGPNQPDPFPDEPGSTTPVTTTTSPTPVPQGAAAPTGLATTGANVFGLVVLSLGLMLAGFGAVVFVRRRRTG